MTHVIKISGYELDEPGALKQLVEVIETLPGEVVLIHGGGSILPRALRHMPDRTQAAEVAAMALRGGINPQLVAALVEQHVQAIGLSGVDLELMYIPIGSSEPIVRFEVLNYLLLQKWVPVVAPLALNLATKQGVVLNADRAARMVASGLGADQLTFLVNTPGIYSQGKRISGISARQYDRYLKQGVIEASYASVLQAAAEAAPYVGMVRITNMSNLCGGVETVVVV